MLDDAALTAPPSETHLFAQPSACEQSGGGDEHGLDEPVALGGRPRRGGGLESRPARPVAPHLRRRTARLHTVRPELHTRQG